MSDKLPNLNYNDSTGQEMGFTKPYSDRTAEVIDEEVKRIVNEQYERAKQILQEYAAQHNQIRDALIVNEVIYHDDVARILGPRKWKSRTDEIIELTKAQDADKPKAIGSKDAADSGDNAREPGVVDDDDADTPPPFSGK